MMVGHNLFLADNEKSIKKPEYAYKLKKQCFPINKGESQLKPTLFGTLSKVEIERTK